MLSALWKTIVEVLFCWVLCICVIVLLSLCCNCHLDWLPTGTSLCTEKCKVAYKNWENDTTAVYGIPSEDTMKGPRWLNCKCYTYSKIKK